MATLPVPAPEPLISIADLNHFFGQGALRNQILFDVSLNIQAGEIIILTGPSGSGKTTLLTLCGALRSVQSGSIRILGSELRGAPNSALEKLRTQVGVIFQAHNLVGALTAQQNVALALGLDPGLTQAQRNERAKTMLEAVGLGMRLQHLPEELSGGQKQRVAIARALVRKPRIILADEPTASLDRKSGREVIELLRTLAQSLGTAVLLVTHDNRILDIADRIVTLEDGHLVSLSSSLAVNTGNILQGFTRLQRSGDLLQHVNALSTKQFLELLESVTAEFRQYVNVFQVGSRDVLQDLFDAVLEATVNKMVQIMHADRGTIYFVDKEAGMLRSRIATGDGTRRISIETGIENSLAGQVVVSGKPANVEDAYTSPFFNPQFDKASGYRTRSMLCMPILDAAGQIFAVGQIINRQHQQRFTGDDEEMFSIFAGPLGVILESCLALQAQIQATPVEGRLP